MTTVEMRGRSRNRSRSPDSTSQMRSTASTSCGQSTNVTCLDVSVTIVKYSTSSRRSRGTSEALTCVHMRSISGSSSMRAVHSRRSCSVLGRRMPVRKSSVLATHPLGAKWNDSVSPSVTSSAGVAPAITNERGVCVMAHSTSSRGRRAMPLASSTSAPRAARSGSVCEPAKRMPTVASTSSAWSTMRPFSSSLSHDVVALMRVRTSADRGPSSCRVLAAPPSDARGVCRWAQCHPGGPLSRMRLCFLMLSSNSTLFIKDGYCFHLLNHR